MKNSVKNDVKIDVKTDMKTEMKTEMKHDVKKRCEQIFRRFRLTCANSFSTKNPHRFSHVSLGVSEGIPERFLAAAVCPGGVPGAPQGLQWVIPGVVLWGHPRGEVLARASMGGYLHQVQKI